MFCNNCGKEILKGKYCETCGDSKSYTNKRVIIGIFIVVVLTVGCVFGYKYYLKVQEEKELEEIQKEEALKEAKRRDDKLSDEVGSVINTCITEYEMYYDYLIKEGSDEEIIIKWNEEGIQRTDNEKFDDILILAFSGLKRMHSELDSNKYLKAIITRRENGVYDIKVSWE